MLHLYIYTCNIHLNTKYMYIAWVWWLLKLRLKGLLLHGGKFWEATRSNRSCCIKLKVCSNVIISSVVRVKTHIVQNVYNYMRNTLRKKITRSPAQKHGIATKVWLYLMYSDYDFCILSTEYSCLAIVIIITIIIIISTTGKWLIFEYDTKFTGQMKNKELHVQRLKCTFFNT